MTSRREERYGDKDEQRQGGNRRSLTRNVERVETVDCVRRDAGEVAAQYVNHLIGLSHHYFRDRL